MRRVLRHQNGHFFEQARLLAFTTMYGACVFCMVNRCIALLFTNCPHKFPSMQLNSSSLVRCVIEAGLSVVRCDIKLKVKVARKREAVLVRSEHPPRRSAPRSFRSLNSLVCPHSQKQPHLRGSSAVLYITTTLVYAYRKTELHYCLQWHCAG